jgi:hypothetical protein
MRGSYHTNLTLLYPYLAPLVQSSSVKLVTNIYKWTKVPFLSSVTELLKYLDPEVSKYR